MDDAEAWEFWDLWRVSRGNDRRVFLASMLLGSLLLTASIGPDGRLRALVLVDAQSPAP